MEENSKPEEISNNIFEERDGHSIPEILKEMSNEKLIKSFYFIENTPEDTQKRVASGYFKIRQK